MPEENIFNTRAEIKIGGSKLSTDENNAVIEVIVDQHTHLPHMFSIRFLDVGLTLLDGGKFDLTKEVEISGLDEDNTKHVLIKGEITAIEPEFQEGHEANLVVRGYDKSHRLFREVKSAAFLNIKDSDLANQFKGSAGLGAGTIDATSTVYDHLYQDNQSDLSFLMQRAWRIGYECFVEEGKLYFRKPLTSGSGVTLTWGESLVSFYPSVTLAEQVDEVMVKGWDIEKQAPIIGQAKAGKLYPKIGESKNGASWAGTFGTGKHIIVDIPVVTQAEADKLAEARLNEISGSFIDAEGTAIRQPGIKAGKYVTLEGLGKRLSGDYMVTKATHTFTTEGLTTRFSVRGTRTGLLSEQLTHQEPMRRWPGVVTAVVTNTDDPNSWGRVKIKYPWMSDDAESDWARVACPGGGPEAGFFVMPEVNDEVLVAFEHGDINRPFVLGGLWNGKNALPPESGQAAAGELPLVRVFRTLTGHSLAFYDNDSNKIELLTAGEHILFMDDANKIVGLQSAGGHTISMDDQGKKVEISTSGGHTITFDDNGRKITVTSSGDIDISGTNINITAKATLNLKGTAAVNIN